MKSLARLSSLALLSTVGLAPTVHAALLAGGTGAQNTTATGSGLTRFNNVFKFGVGSATYLGDGWILTALHVQGGVTDPATFNINGQSFLQDGPFQRLTTSNGDGADLVLMHTAGNVGLPSVQIGSTPAASTPTTLVGFGANRAVSKTYWNVTSNLNKTTASDPDYIWTQSSPANSNASGYLYGTGASKRWGTNVTGALDANGSYVANPSPNQNVHPTFVYNTQSWLGSTELFATRFDESGGTSEASVADGDSGGAVFNSSNNRLIGVPLYLGRFANQPDASIAFGNVSYYANLASYADQIASITHWHPSIDGDANLDGIVNEQDFKILKSNFETGTNWTQGDFNIDGTVDFRDFQILERNFGLSSPAGASADLDPSLINSVPEPASATLLVAFAAAPLLSRRRR